MSDPVFEAFRRKLADVVTVAINSGKRLSSGDYDAHCPLSCGGYVPRSVTTPAMDYGLSERDALTFACSFDGCTGGEGPYYELGRLYRSRFP